MAPKVSQKPWGDYKPSDYTDQQWRAACLISGKPGNKMPAKIVCKLPVRTPDGTLNRAGMAAAAAALGGARGGLIASDADKAAAKKALVKLYNQLNEQLPPSLMHSAVEVFLAQHGDKGLNSLNHAQSANSTLVCLVALPRETDPIRLVGDVDKHATLLFFGEMSTLPSDAKTVLLETLQNVSFLFTPFSESIVDISRLGTDNPPALVATLTDSNLSKIRQALLINPKVGEYLQNTNQQPIFTPHVTLAYPDYQGETDIRKTMTQLFRVRFDRLALWWGDEHIDFSLDMNDVSMNDMSVAQAEQLEAFLAHHGVKGMKWGIRRSPAQLSGNTTLSTKTVTEKDMKKMRPGSVVTRVHGSTGETTTLIKKEDGTWAETHLSADAERLVKTNQKAQHEMSDKELKDAATRARLIEDYNKFFTPKPNAELKSQVDQLELQKKASELHSVMHPSKKAKVVAFVAGSAAAYEAYHKLNKASDGALSANLRGGLARAGMRQAGKHALGVPVKLAAEAVA